MLKKYQSSLTLTFLFTILLLYLTKSNLIIKEFLNYTNLFITKLFPTTFIIYIFSNIFIEYGIINKLSKIFKNKASTIYIIVMSIISGFPSGPKHIKDLLTRNYITLDQANYLIYFTHFPNPLFILGTVSMIISSKIQTLKLFISLLLSNFVTALLISKPKYQSLEIPKYKEKDFSSVLSDSIISSLKISLLIYGTSIFFYLIATLINNYLNLSLTSYIILNAFFDLTKGITLTSLITNETFKSIFIILLISIGSLNINIQIKSILADTSIKYSNFLKGRLISTIFAIIIYLIIKNL